MFALELSKGGNTMHAVSSLLDATSNRKLEALWNELEMRFGLKGIRITPIPHFSWQIASHYDWEKSQLLLDELAKDILPFTLRVAGLGIFTGNNPVLYLPLVKDRLVLEIHELLWQTFDGLNQEVSTHYHPDAWIPHITLAHSDVTSEKIAEVIKALAFQVFDWECQIDNLALIKQSAGEVGELAYRTPLCPS
jgi:2'-5' RNA ligase